MSTANPKPKRSVQAGVNKDVVEAKQPFVPTPAERALVESLYSKAKKEPPAPKLKVEQGKAGAQIGFDHRDPTTARALLANALGTTDADFINGILTQLANATGKGSDASSII